MGCNCSKSSRTISTAKMVSNTRRFVFTDRKGESQEFGSRLEAEAARARQGGGTIRPA